MCSADILWRVPISACPIFSRTYYRCTVLILLAIVTRIRCMAFESRGRLAGFLLTCLVIDAMTRTRRAVASSRLLQVFGREPAHHDSRGERVKTSWFSSRASDRRWSPQ